jgi:uncharacterized cupin superfamily protein
MQKSRSQPGGKTMTSPIVNLSELTFAEFGKGDRFRAERAPVSTQIGASNLGYSVVKLAPGKRAWPFHSHHVVEEMFYILKGQGTLRHADKEYPVREGDFICSPADPQQAHQIVNSSEEELMYLALSTQEVADVMLYPDSGKYGVCYGTSGDPGGPDSFLVFARKETAVDYWDGESE